MKKLTRTCLIAVAALLLGGSVFPVQRAQADAFMASHVIDDSYFDNSNSMGASQIDSFLNSFPGSCISTNRGFSAQDPIGYSPSSSYVYGGNVSGGSVIAHAAQAYDINPQVLLVTLEKEQSLVRGGAGCSNLRYVGATGYGCPDSGTTHDYSGLNLYALNGTTVSSVNGTCVNTASKAGFTQQVIRAAWLLKFGEQRSEGHINWAIVKGNWNNSDDPQSCYGGPMTQGTFQRCPSGGSAFYDGYITIDGTSTHMDNGATAALYWYTPHFSGNQNFFSLFSQWFGSPVGCPALDSSFVYRLHNTNTGDFLYTPNVSEICQATKYYGYGIEGMSMQPLAAGDPSASPAFRLSRQGGHFFTAIPAERDQAQQLYGFSSEGVAYNVSTVQTGNTYPIYRLSKNGTYFFTASAPERDMMSNSGYVYQGVAYFAKSTSNKTPVYRLSRRGIHLFTSSAVERSMAIAAGYSDEGLGFYAQTGTTGDDLTTFRLVRNGHYLLTNSLGEELIALKSGYQLETSYFFVYPPYYPGTIPVYRLSNAATGDYFYTSNPTERDQAIQLYGYRDEGPAFGASTP